MDDDQIKELVNRFLAWPLPQSACADPCATDRTYPYKRSGTNLLTAEEAEAMFRHVLAAGASEGQAEPIYQGRSKGEIKWLDQSKDAYDHMSKFPLIFEVRALYTHPSAEIAALRERIAGMEKDAGRYRWMRDWYLRGGARREIHPNGHIERTTAEIIDQGIDAAIAKEPK